MKFKFNHPTDRLLIFILVLVVALQSAILWHFGERLNILSLDNNRPLNANIRQAIQDANISLYKDAAVDALGHRVYFPDLNVYVPLNEKTQTMVYNYGKAEGFPAEAAFSAKSVQYSFLNTFADVACVQRLVSVSVDKPNPSSWPNQEGSGVVKLKDGRTLYLYKNKASGCSNLWTTVSPDDIVASLKQAQSY